MRSGTTTFVAEKWVRCWITCDTSRVSVTLAKQQDEACTVIPLMVLKVPNTPDTNDIGRALDTTYQQWPVSVQ